MKGYKETTLCWECANACPNAKKGTGCSWSREFKPVEGWEATQTLLHADSPLQKRRIESFKVIKCPEFKSDARRYNSVTAKKAVKKLNSEAVIYPDNRIRYEVKYNGWTIKSLAEASGIGEETLRKYMYRQKPISEKSTFRLCSALKCEPSFLYEVPDVTFRHAVKKKYPIKYTGGNVFQYYRSERGISIMTAVEMIGLSHGVIALYEKRALDKVPFESFLKFCHAYGKTPKEVYIDQRELDRRNDEKQEKTGA